MIPHLTVASVPWAELPPSNTAHALPDLFCTCMLSRSLNWPWVTSEWLPAYHFLCIVYLLAWQIHAHASIYPPLEYRETWFSETSPSLRPSFKLNRLHIWPILTGIFISFISKNDNFLHYGLESATSDTNRTYIAGTIISALFEPIICNNLNLLIISRGIAYCVRPSLSCVGCIGQSLLEKMLLMGRKLQSVGEISK